MVFEIIAHRFCSRKGQVRVSLKCFSAKWNPVRRRKRGRRSQPYMGLGFCGRIDALSKEGSAMKLHRAVLATAFTLAAAGTPAKAAIVCGLSPYGDNFLSLRSGPGAGFPEIRRLGPSTFVVVQGRRGPWRLVRLLDGLQGWVHGRGLC
jgi:hypothetical protein